MTYIDTLGQQAKVASRQIAKLSTAAKNDLLNQVAKALVAESDYIITENAKDMANASENGISKIMQDRLLLTEDRIAGIAEGVRQVADLQDPIGQVVRGYTNLDGLKIVQKRVPMGVIAMIFESRPNVSIDAFSLAFKTNNAIILRGGRDAINSNKALVTVARKALKNAGITCEEGDDWVCIHPGKPQPCRIETFDDHRVAMAFAVMGLGCDGIEILNPGCCKKTFENYFVVLDSLLKH